MNDPAPFFTAREHMAFEGILATLKKAAMVVPIYCVLEMLAIPALGIVLYVDWEIYFRIFDYLTAGAQFWNPHIIACTGGIMLLGFHLLAKNDSRHPVVKTVTRLSALIILAFVIGGGFYIAGMLYADGMGDLGGGGVDIFDTQEPEASWIDMVFAKVTSPTAVLALSLGIGGLSIVSLFVGHALLSAIYWLGKEIYERSAQFAEGRSLMRTITGCEDTFGQLQDELLVLSGRDDAYWKLHLADRALETVTEHLIPHEEAQQEAEFNAVDHRWETDDRGVIAIATPLIKKLRAITLADILAAIDSINTTRKAK